VVPKDEGVSHEQLVSFQIFDIAGFDICLAIPHFVVEEI
jgi:hypothetical protein